MFVEERWRWPTAAELATDLASGRVTASQVKELARKDPVGWIEAVFGVELWEKQRQIVRRLFLEGCDRLAVPASFSVGKTFVAACCVLYFLYNYPPAKVITIAPTWRQVFSLLWREIRKLYKRALDNGWGLQGTLLKTELTVDEDWFAMGFSTQTADEDAIDRITGFHQRNMMVVFDQAGGLDPLWWKAAKAMLTGETNKWIAFGNTAIYNCYFRRACEERHLPAIGDWEVVKISAFDSPNVQQRRVVVPGLVTWDWVRDVASVGEDDPLYRIYVLAEFVPQSDLLLIPPQKVEEARSHWAGMSGEAVAGLDVALQGGDWSVFLVLDRRTGQLLMLKRIKGNRTNTLTDFVLGQVRQFQHLFPSYTVQAIAVDAIGVGAGVYDRLVEKAPAGIVILPVVGSEKPSDARKFANRRAENAWMLRERFLRAEIGFRLGDERLEQTVDRFALQDLLEELANVPYSYDRQSRIKLPAKDELRPFFSRSPDCFDALVYANVAAIQAGRLGVLVVEAEAGTQPESYSPWEDEELWQEL